MGLAETITHNATQTGWHSVRVYGYPVGNGSFNATSNYTLTANFSSGAITITTPPQDRTVIESASAIFNVLAGGAQPLAYQWQRYGTNLPGANANSYVTPPVTLADSGAQFRVIVTNAFGAVTSTWATLTVNAANTITWTGGAGTSEWNNPMNWDLTRQPTASDRVVINSGSVNIPPSASFSVMELNNGVITGTLNISGTVNLATACVNAEVAVVNGGVLNINGMCILGGTLRNEGAVIIWPGGTMPGNLDAPGAVITNLPGAVFELLGNAMVGSEAVGRDCAFFGSVFSAFHNAGLVRVLAVTNGAWLRVGNFANTGMVDVRSGTLNFSHGLTSSGLVNTEAGAVVDLGGGSSVFNPGALFTGSGSVRLAGNLSGWLAGENCVLSSGTIRGSFTNAGTLNWTGGNLNGAMTVAAGGVLNVSGSGNKIFYPSALNNAGTINWTGGNLLAINNELGGDQVLINNLSGGVFNVQSDANLAVACPSCFPGISLVFTNSGLIRKSGTTGTNSLGFNYNLDTVDVQSGTLYVSPGYTQAAAGTLKIQIGGLTPSAQHGQLVVNGPATLDGALQVSFSNNFVAGNGDFFNILSYASRSGGFASSSAGALGLTESYTSTNLLLIAGSNAYPSLSFTVMGGNTQTVCVPFQLLATAADADGAVTNVAILLDGSPIASAVGSPVAATAEIDFPGVYTFTANAQDNKGDGRSATQTVALIAYPVHVLTAGGFRTNGAFKLCIVGETNHDYQVLASTNLSTTNWVIIGVMEPTNGIWRFLDTGASNQPFRFYRAEQLP